MSDIQRMRELAGITEVQAEIVGAKRSKVITGRVQTNHVELIGSIDRIEVDGDTGEFSLAVSADLQTQIKSIFLGIGAKDVKIEPFK